MGIQDVQQLSPELRQAVVPAVPLQPYQPDNPVNPGSPLNTPETVMSQDNPSVPMRGPGSGVADMLASPPEIPNNPLSPVTTGGMKTLSSEIAKAADQLKIPSGPGGWARSLVGAAQSALSGIQTSLGDASAAAKDIQPGQGILAMIGNQRNVKAARQQEEQKTQTLQERERALIAHSNVETIYQQKLIHQLDDKANHEDIQSGKDAVNNFTTHLSEMNLAPASIIAKDITEDQLSKAMQDNNLDPSYNHIFPTGVFQPYDPKTGKPMIDKDGNPMMQKTYTVIGNVPEVVLDDKNAKLISDNIAGIKFEAGQRLSGAQGASLIQQALNHQTVQKTIDHNLKKSELEELDTDQKIAQHKAINTLGADFANVFAQSDADMAATTAFMTGQHQIRKIVNGRSVMVPDPASQEMAVKHPTAFKDIMDSVGGEPNYLAIVDRQKKEANDRRHDIEMERAKAQKDALSEASKHTYEGDFNLSGQDFLNSLKPDERPLVSGIASGQVDLTKVQRMLNNNPNLLTAVLKLDPSFNISKVSGYAGAVKKFMSGKAADEVKAGGVAFKHLKELYELNTLKSRVYGTEDYQKYQNKLDTLVDELGKFYGNATIPGLEGYRKTLGAVLNRDVAIQTQAQSMQDRFESLQNEWDNAAPGEGYKRTQGAMPGLDQSAKDAAAFILSDGKDPRTGQAAQPHQPAQTTGSGGDFFQKFGGVKR